MSVVLDIVSGLAIAVANLISEVGDYRRDITGQNSKWNADFWQPENTQPLRDLEMHEVTSSPASPTSATSATTRSNAS